MIIKQSGLFTKTLREAPKGEEAANAILLERGGFIYKEASGVYDYLPLGWRALQKINNIIREEIDNVGGQELHMAVLQNKETWEATGRWQSAADVMYQFKDQSGKEVGLGWTHEEPLTAAAKKYISSYKDLPKAVYQIQVKFRHEPRAKSGLLRGREFLMKDLYSFHADQKDLDEYYEKVAEAYKKIFARAGVKARRTLASGGLFSKYSDEFQVLSETGEDTIFYCQQCSYAANKEVAQDLKLSDKCPDCAEELLQGRSIEVGNIFKLGTKFSENIGLNFTDKDGKDRPAVMASYGIGPGRLMGTLVEVSHDEKGIIWPQSVAPFDCHLLVIPSKSSGDKVRAGAEKVAQQLTEAGYDVLYDDREDATAGEKFADRDLLGMPLSVIVSEKGLTDNTIEVVKRKDMSAQRLSTDKALKLIETEVNFRAR